MVKLTMKIWGPDDQEQYERYQLEKVMSGYDYGRCDG